MRPHRRLQLPPPLPIRTPMLLPDTFRPMNRKSEQHLVVGLDIATSKVVAVVGEYLPGEPVEVIGLGSHISRGMKKGAVVDIESTVHSIQRAVEEAELMAGCDIRSVYASRSEEHTSELQSPVH